MPTDLRTLLQRDHHDLERGLDELLAPSASLPQIRSALDGVRLGLGAHAEAQDIVLAHAIARCAAPEELRELVARTRVAHLAQEGALAALVCAPPDTSAWRDRATHLRALVHEHAAYEDRHVIPAIAELAPDLYATLAGAFATERLRQLAMLQPSAPIIVPELAVAS